jgi:hypothetical protein
MGDSGTTCGACAEAHLRFYERLKNTPNFLGMPVRNGTVRVLYSFPHKLGAARICTTAWYQVKGIAAAGAKVTVYTGSICR